jgi:hypothetical protein
VQAWLDNPATNFGWILKDDENTPATSARRLNSHENATNPPQLFIRFTLSSAAVIFQDDFEAVTDPGGCPAP